MSHVLRYVTWVLKKKKIKGKTCVWLGRPSFNVVLSRSIVKYFIFAYYIIFEVSIAHLENLLKFFLKKKIKVPKKVKEKKIVIKILFYTWAVRVIENDDLIQKSRVLL